jgi:outer membrane protein TolC
MKNIVKISVVFLGAMLFTGRVSGQTRLADLINYALEHSTEIKKANLQVEENSYMRKEIHGQGFPQIEAMGNYSMMGLPEITISDGLGQIIPQDLMPLLQQLSNINALYTASAGVQVTQLLYSQSYLVGLKTARKSIELYELLRNKTREDVIEEVANSYYQSLALMLQLNTIDKSLKNLKDLYHMAELSYRNDMIRENDVNRLKVAITNLEVNRQTVSNVIDIQLNYLKVLAGMPADMVVKPDTSLMAAVITTDALKTVFAVENVPSYQLLLKQSEINGNQILLAKSKYMPVVAAYGQFNFSSYNTTPGINHLSNMNTIGARLSVPIFTSGVNRSRIKQSMLRKEQTDETILKTKDLLNISYSNARSEYETAISLLDVQRENRNLSQKVYNQTSAQFREGMSSMADVLNVNSDFIQAENSYNQQILKCRFSEIKMLKSTGNLNLLITKN